MIPEDITIYELNQAIKLIRRVCVYNKVCETCPFREINKHTGENECGLISNEPQCWGEVEEDDDPYEGY